MIEEGKILQQRYCVERQIGQGGMGAVYIATDTRFGTAVAIKETLCPDENCYRAVEREARLLNSLKHPALPKVSDHFVEDKVQFLVMEYIPGDDLSVMLARYGKPFPVRYVLGLGDRLLDALEYLHGQQTPVVHRDIKPQNLKVTPDGQVILLDFGLAKGNPTDASHQTAAHSLFGYSRHYASLEQIQGTGTDPRSDIYALAATLYHLSTGQLPVDALTRAMKVLGRGNDPLLPAHIVYGEVPIGVSAVLQRAMDLDSDQRPGSAKELRRMLKEHERYAESSFVRSAVDDAGTAIAIDEDTDLETKIRSGPTQPQSTILTEVLPAPVSIVTSLPVGLMTDPDANGAATKATPSLMQPASSYRRAAVLASIALLFSVVGSFSAAAIYYGPSKLLGPGRSANSQHAEAFPEGSAPNPLDSGSGIARPDTNNAPETGSSVPSEDPIRPADPPLYKDPLAEPEGTRPTGPRATKTEPALPDQTPKVQNIDRKGKRKVETVEIDRLPGGVRGLRVTRERNEPQQAKTDKDNDGFRLTKIPSVFKKLPSKMRIISPKDESKKKTRQ